MIPATVDIDLFSDAVLSEPYETFAALRQLGDVVWLPRCQAYAITRYQGVRSALLDHHTFSSARGVGLNSGLNDYQRGTLLGSDPPEHTKLRSLVADAFTPGAIRQLEDTINGAGLRLVTEVTRRGSFDAIEELAAVLPTNVVSDMLGLPRTGRHRLLHMSDHHFNACGPLGDHLDGPVNQRVADSWREMQTASAYIGFMAKRIAPGSIGARLFAAASKGEISEQQALKLLTTLMGAGVDTTVRTIGNAIRCFIDHPEQWQLLREQPELLTAAINEVIRFDSPSQMLARYVTREVTVNGWTIPAESRVLLLFASANRDEQAFERADRFDIRRDAKRGHLSFSAGNHSCPGQALARLEIQSIIRALLARVERIELAGTPQRKINSTLRGYAHLPVRVHATIDTMNTIEECTT